MTNKLSPIIYKVSNISRSEDVVRILKDLADNYEIIRDSSLTLHNEDDKEVTTLEDFFDEIRNDSKLFISGFGSFGGIVLNYGTIGWNLSGVSKYIFGRYDGLREIKCPNCISYGEAWAGRPGERFYYCSKKEEKDVVEERGYSDTIEKYHDTGCENFNNNFLEEDAPSLEQILEMILREG